MPGEPTNSVGGRSPQTILSATSDFSFGIPEFLERPAFPDERRNQIADTMTLSAGNHTFKFGGDINFVKDIINNIRFAGGEFNYTGASALGDFIVDYTNFTTNGAIRALTLVVRRIGHVRQLATTRAAGQCYAGNFNQGIGPSRSDDEDHRLQLLHTGRLARHSAFDPESGLALRVPEEPGCHQRQSGVAADGHIECRTRTTSARASASPMTPPATARPRIRGGYGIYYGRVINSTVYNALINTGLGPDRSQQQLTISATNLPAGCTAATCLPIYPNLLVPIGSTNTNVVVRPSVQFFDADFQLPQIHQTDFIVERQIAKNTVVSASYLFSFGNSLPNFVDTNLPAPTRFVALNVVGGPFDQQPFQTPIFLGPRPNTAFNQITAIRSNVFSKYHALVLQANRRLTGGLQFQTNYTLSRAQDNGQTSATFTLNNAPFNAFDQGFENGLSNFDRRHKFVTSLVYNTNFASLKDNAVGRAILNGWTIAPILNAFSGQRYSGNITGSIAPASFGFTGAACTGGAGTCSTPGGGVNGSGGSGRFSGVPRNFFKQPNIWYLDMRLSRRFNLTEGTKLEVLAEAFNLFNRTQVTSVSTTLYNLAGNTLTFAPAFGTTTGADSTLFRERQVQLAVRFEF